jgi:hypothetical protein
MKRKGRDLEKVISLLEGALQQSGIQLKSPDFLPDKDTGMQREVDISLRGRIGSSDILAIIECRDRDATQDVTWIEQVISKRSSVNADKVLAVSSSKFSEPARIKAEKNNIELRTLDEINPSDIQDWFVKFPYVLIHRLKPEIMRASFYPQNPDGNEIDAYAPIFKRKLDNKSVSLTDILSSIPIEKIYQYIPLDGTKVLFKFTLNYPNEQDRFQMSTKLVDIDIESLKIDVFLSIEDEKVPPSSMKVYRNADKDIAKIQDFRFNINGIECALCFHKSELDGTRKMSVITDVEPNNKNPIET